MVLIILYGIYSLWSMTMHYCTINNIIITVNILMRVYKTMGHGANGSNIQLYYTILNIGTHLLLYRKSIFDYSY